MDDTTEKRETGGIDPESLPASGDAAEERAPDSIQPQGAIANESETSPEPGDSQSSHGETLDELPTARGASGRFRLWLTAAATLTLCAVIGLGLLLKFVLSWRGGGAWLGLSRHDWGQVHFWLAVVMLALVVTHLVVHRAWIASCWTRHVGSLRSPLTWVLAGAGLLLMVLPLVIPASGGGPGRARSGGRGPAVHHKRPPIKNVAHSKKNVAHSKKNVAHSKKGKPSRPGRARPNKRPQRPRPKR